MAGPHAIEKGPAEIAADCGRLHGTAHTPREVYDAMHGPRP